MHVLVTWGSKHGGTEGIARIIGEALQRQGFEVSLIAANKVRDVAAYDAAVVGGALYSNLWHRDARRFISRNVHALQRIPVWVFSSGPLDDSADRAEIPPTPQVQTLMERIGACGHVTFGGRLSADAKGFPASAMAKQYSGDYRNPERIRAWASDLAHALPDARPGIPVEAPARSTWRLLGHALAGWALCAGVMVALSRLPSTALAVTLYNLAAPAIFALVAWRYFRPRGARDPMAAAFAFTLTMTVLHFAVAEAHLRASFEVFSSFAGTWLPMVWIFLSTWIIGSIASMMPAPASDAAQRRRERRQARRHAHGSTSS